jgi:hypothetical protein
MLREFVNAEHGGIGVLGRRMRFGSAREVLSMSLEPAN